MDFDQNVRPDSESADPTDRRSKRSVEQSLRDGGEIGAGDGKTEEVPGAQSV